MSKISTLRQLLVFGIVGILANGIGYLIYLLITYFGVDPKMTMSILFALGATFNFVANRKMTFDHRGDRWRAGALFALVYGSGWLINYVLLRWLVDSLGYSHQLVQFCAIFIVGAYLFIAQKTVVFRA